MLMDHMKFYIEIFYDDYNFMRKGRLLYKETMEVIEY